jgi:cytochrome c oxidase subunit 2
MRRLLLLVAVTASSLVLPSVALAHDPSPSPTASAAASALAEPAASAIAAPSVAATPSAATPVEALLGPSPVATGPDTPSMLRPESPGGTDIRTLTIEIIAILSGVAITVWVLLTIVVIRYRHRPEAQVRQTQGNTGIEILWTAIPAVIVAVLFLLTIRTTGQLAIPASTQVHYAATGHQWWWEFQFSGGVFKTANEIYLPVDTTISADLLSTDVIHSYWVPQLGGKVDMIPGHINRIAFIPSQIGRYLGECSEYCGHQHANMRFLVYVVPSARFSTWFAGQQLPARQPTGVQARAGREYIATISCGGCHTIRGTSLAGVIGPDLTHFGSRSSIAAVTLVNTPMNLTRWIGDPQAVKPETKMPLVPMPPERLAAIVAYLEELK